jgi:hypothetical protein
MRSLRWLAVIGVLVLAGCTGGSNREGSGKAAARAGEAEIKAALAKLSPEDRKLAEAQKFCAVETENRLGSMGVPVKVIVKGQPVFLCCKGCRKSALAYPDKTLATVKALKKKVAEAPAK